MALLLLLNLFWQLPSRDTLSSKAQLQGLHILELVLSCASCSLHETADVTTASFDKEAWLS